MQKETVQIRIYKEDYKLIKEKADEDTTTFARIVHDLWKETHPDLEHD